MLHPRKVGVTLGRNAVFPAYVLFVAVPVRIVERRIGNYLAGFEIFVQVAVKRVGAFFAQIAIDTTNREVHHRQLACGRIGCRESRLI